MTTNGIRYMTKDEKDALLAVAKTRGEYKLFMTERLADPEFEGVVASDVWPSRQAASIYQGLNTVKKNLNLEGVVRVINHDSKVYLIKVDAADDAGEDEDSE